MYTYRPPPDAVRADPDRDPGAGRGSLPGTPGSRTLTISSIVLVPEFSQQSYPGDMWYPLGYTYGDTNWEPRANWTFTAIEHLFDYVRTGTGPPGSPIFLTGTAPGGRLSTGWRPSSPTRGTAPGSRRKRRGVLMPDYSIPYPFGLKDSPLPQSGLATVFSRKLIIMSGGSDTNPNDTSLASFPLAEAEGSTRFAGTGLLCTCTGTGSCTRRPAQLGVPCRPGHRAR